MMFRFASILPWLGNRWSVLIGTVTSKDVRMLLSGLVLMGNKKGRIFRPFLRLAV